MTICGSCKTPSVSTAHVRSCYATKYTVAADLLLPLPVPAAMVETVVIPEPAPVVQATSLALIDVPPAKYAVEVDDQLIFVKVTAGTKNPAVRFVDKLIGAPAAWRKVKLSWPQAQAILDTIRHDDYLYVPELVAGEAVLPAVQYTGPQAAAVRYSATFTRCACCEAPLSDPVSRAQGLGPVCITRFAA